MVTEKGNTKIRCGTFDKTLRHPGGASLGGRDGSDLEVRAGEMVVTSIYWDVGEIAQGESRKGYEGQVRVFENHNTEEAKGEENVIWPCLTPIYLLAVSRFDKSVEI